MRRARENTAGNPTHLIHGPDSRVRQIADSFDNDDVSARPERDFGETRRPNEPTKLLYRWEHESHELL
jgi:hypothetical protein